MSSEKSVENSSCSFGLRPCQCRASARLPVSRQSKISSAIARICWRRASRLGRLLQRGVLKHLQHPIRRASQLIRRNPGLAALPRTVTPRRPPPVATTPRSDVSCPSSWRAAVCSTRRRLRRRHSLTRRLDVEAHEHDSTLHHVEGSGGLPAQVEDPAGHVGATIVHPYPDDSAVLEVRHPEAGAERQGAVRGREPRHVEDLARRREPALVRAPVPGGDAHLGPALDRPVSSPAPVRREGVTRLGGSPRRSPRLPSFLRGATHPPSAPGGLLDRCGPVGKRAGGRSATACQHTSRICSRTSWLSWYTRSRTWWQPGAPGACGVASTRCHPSVD